MTERTSPSDAALTEAVRVLGAGGLVAIPTETVYGLGADATSPSAVARIYAAKGRPSFNPLISHLPDVAAARREGVFDATAEKLAAAFWPGPLTLVLPRQAEGSVCDLACAGLASVGLRVPAHRGTLELLRRFGRPVAAPSANRSGRISPTRAADVIAELGGEVDFVLDGGACPVGLESTIVACLDGKATLLRPGGVPREAIEAVLGQTLQMPQGGGIAAPGMMASHYAPRAAVRLGATGLEEGETGLDFANRLGGAAALDLSPSGDLIEAAAHLYEYLRRLDALGTSGIAVAPIPEHGIGAAINDRLRRAAAPRG